MSRRHDGSRIASLPPIAAALVFLLAGAAAPAEPAAEGPVAGGPTIIRLHVGVPGRAFIGQARAALLEAFPGAVETPFARQQDAISFQAKEAGIACVLAGPSPTDLRVASVGFNLEGTYEGIGEGEWRTEAGIGKGSTVNDLLATYGKPGRLVDQGARGRSGSPPAPEAPTLYQYYNTEGTVSTSFVVLFNRVVRIVVNHLDPLERHLIRRSPTEPAPAPPGSDPAPDPAPPQPPPDPAAPPS